MIKKLEFVKLNTPEVVDLQTNKINELVDEVNNHQTEHDKREMKQEDKILCDYCGKEAEEGCREIAGIMCDKCYKSKSYPRLEQMKPTSKTNDWEKDFENLILKLSNKIKDSEDVFYLCEADLKSFISSLLKSQRKELSETYEEKLMEAEKRIVKFQREEFIREKEVIYKPFEDKKEYSNEKCRACNGKLYHSQIPCPNPPGENINCCVIHYGYICEDCGKIYQ